jgi:hypothetical protein
VPFRLSRSAQARAAVRHEHGVMDGYRSCSFRVPVLAVAVLAGSVAAIAPAAAAGRAGRPGQVSFSVSGVLHAVAATSAGNAWAVGWTYTGTRMEPLVVHWNGTSWTPAAP